MSYLYKTKGTCSTQIEVDLDGNIVKNVKFTGGCHGNLQAIPRLVEGMTVEEVERRISGIRCGMKNTSCGDQLAKALREAYEAQKNDKYYYVGGLSLPAFYDSATTIG